MGNIDKVRLVEVTLDNLREVCRLSDTLMPEQQRCVASNAYSIAEASFFSDIIWYRAVYLGDAPIGFFLLRFDQGSGKELKALLWRFMIARPYQGKGFGRQVLDLIVRKCREEGVRVLNTSVDMGEASPFGFYTSYGFKDTGESFLCGERVLRLELEE